MVLNFLFNFYTYRYVAQTIIQSVKILYDFLVRTICIKKQLWQGTCMTMSDMLLQDHHHIHLHLHYLPVKVLHH